MVTNERKIIKEGRDIPSKSDKVDFCISYMNIIKRRLSTTKCSIKSFSPTANATEPLTSNTAASKKTPKTHTSSTFQVTTFI